MFYKQAYEKKETKSPTKKIETMQNEKPSLKSILDAKKEAFAAKADETKKQVYADGITDVRESGILKSAKQVGDKAPNFALSNAQNQEVELSALLKDR